MKEKKIRVNFFISLILFLCLGFLVPGIAKAEDTTYKPTIWDEVVNSTESGGQLAGGGILDLTDVSLPADASGKTITVNGISVTIKGSESKTYKNLAIVIKGGATVTIENLNITNVSFSSSPIIAGDSNSNNALKFSGTNNIIATAQDYSGIQVITPAAITIEGDNTSSKLQVTGGEAGAGIGGGFFGDGGIITIKGSGTITAIGGGTGIGGGYYVSGGTISIEGSGTVTAIGGSFGAAGIGGGYYVSGGIITIGGSGTVTATGGERGAGIGGGYNGNGGTITIGGSGIVTATGGTNGAGIGGGTFGSGGIIAIGGSGTVTATGGTNGAGIGGGPEGNGGAITIEGSGTVTATGGTDGAGIGGGSGGSGGTVLIGGSATVTANGSGSTPVKLTGVPPTVIGLSDGKITGTTTAMEYKLSSPGVSTYIDCLAGETGGLAPGSYLVRIKADPSKGNTASEAVTVSVPPAAPTGLAGVAPTVIGLSDGKIIGTTTAMEYKLSSSEVSTYIDCLAGETGGLAPGSYSVRIKADSSTGNTTSSAVTVTVPTSNVPAAPIGLTATAGVLKVGLSWNAVPAATSYKVYKSTTHGSSYELVSDNINTTSTETTGLTAGTTYYFVVKASKDGVDSANSDEVSAIPQADTEKPVIHLNGVSPVNLAYGATYTDEGVAASDNVDGDITTGIVKTIANSSGTTVSDINTTQAGTYTIHYNVRDAAGNAADEITRTVVVQAYVPPYVPPYIPPAPQPVIENRQASIKVGKGEASVQVMVERITYPDGTKKDTIVFDENTTEKIIEEALKEKTTFADIYITDTSVNPPDIMDIKFPKASSEKLADNGMVLSLKTEKAAFYLTPETLAKLKGKDVEITISKEKDSSEIGNTKALILNLVLGAQIISDTLKIEANYTGRTKITIPIDPATLPKDKEELNKFIASLAVFVKHSNGKIVIDKGSIVYDEKGNPIAISIFVDNFSSFTLIKLPENYFNGRSTIIPDKVSADKEWHITFTKPAAADTVTNDSIYVLDSKGNKVEVNVSYGLDNVLIVTPVKPYTSGESYYLYITKAVKDKYKKPLAEDLRYEFVVK